MALFNEKQIGNVKLPISALRIICTVAGFSFGVLAAGMAWSENIDPDFGLGGSGGWRCTS